MDAMLAGARDWLMRASMEEGGRGEVLEASANLH